MRELNRLHAKHPQIPQLIASAQELETIATYAHQAHARALTDLGDAVMKALNHNPYSDLGEPLETICGDHLIRIYGSSCRRTVEIEKINHVGTDCE